MGNRAVFILHNKILSTSKVGYSFQFKCFSEKENGKIHSQKYLNKGYTPKCEIVQKYVFVRGFKMFVTATTYTV